MLLDSVVPPHVEAVFVEDYNQWRYHESLDNVTPADVYHGRRPAILVRREQITQRALASRRQGNLKMPHGAAQGYRFCTSAARQF